MCDSAWRISSPTRKGRWPVGADDFFFLGISTLQLPGLAPESSTPRGIPGQRLRLGLVDPRLFFRAIRMGIIGMPVPRAALHRSIGRRDAGMGAEIIPKREMTVRLGRSHGEEVELRHPAIPDLRRAIPPPRNAVFPVPAIAERLDRAALLIEGR